MPRYRKSRTGNWIKKLSAPFIVAATLLALPGMLLFDETDDKDDKKDKKSDKDDPDDEDLSDDEKKALDEKGRTALRRERRARRKAEKDARDERQRREQLEREQQDKSKNNNDADDGDKINADDLRRQMRVETAKERAVDKAEIAARDAGVPKDKMRRFLKIVDLDDVVDDDGAIDLDLIEEAVEDALEDVPEFAASNDDDADDEDDDQDDVRDRKRDRDRDRDADRSKTRRRRDPAHQGPRRKTTEPLDERVKSRVERIKEKTGLS